MSNTLDDLKRLLDSGEALVGHNLTVWKSPKPNQYYVSDGFRTNEYGWQMVETAILVDPSLWRQRDQIGAEKQRTVVVDAREWEEMNEELKRLREQVK